MKYIAEMGSGFMIYMPSLIKNGSNFTVDRGKYMYRHTNSKVV
jgi:hypothetical protein